MNLLSPEYKNWGKTVKKTLIDREMTIVELAKILHLSRITVVYAISGNRPSKIAIKCISEYLGIPAP